MSTVTETDATSFEESRELVCAMLLVTVGVASSSTNEFVLDAVLVPLCGTSIVDSPYHTSSGVVIVLVI